jgi:molybdopterin/thiamine biosynthesis adenylyltransferase
MPIDERTEELIHDDRFDRFRRVEWWDQSTLSAAKILVIGAGALGNEVLKNLALLGVGNIFVADLDTIEESNLSRSILYRERDAGRPKAEVAAASVREIYPRLRASHFHGDAIFGLGLGVYRWADIVIAGLDSREARLHVNRCCRKVNRPWIDGATETLQGIVRAFISGGPCYECTMTAKDWEAIKERRGCAGLQIEGLPLERVPTTPITASIIGALQCQEALKLLHGLNGLAGKGAIFNGLSNDFYVVPYNRDEECNSHDTLMEVILLRDSARDFTPRQMLALAEEKLGPGSTLELTHELLVAFDCPGCRHTQEVYKPLASVPEREATCPDCGLLRRTKTVKSISGHETLIDRPFINLGVSLFDIVTARRGLTAIGFELGGDAPAVLGELWQSHDQQREGRDAA